MAINFPGSLDNFTNPTSASPINSPSHADQHANANDAIEALEAKVGVDGSSVVTSHDYKIAQLQSLVTSAVAGAKSIYQDVRNQSGSAFTKATPVYVSGSTGASGQLLVSAASNATEATSSKTMGITTSAISDNSNGQVISEGILEGIDTTGAADGDPVWLGVDGAKIYGLANKPSAPAHLVFLGIVIRGGQANTGSMYVKIQNGFELQEIHNVEISSLINGNILTYDSTTQTWKNTNTIQSTSSTIPLVVKASTSQSVAMQQWQDSGGTIQSEIRNSGQFRNQAGAILGNRNGVTLGILTLYNNNAAVIPLVVQAAASQTANLQEWQNSSGNVLSKIDSFGAFKTASTASFGTISGGGVWGGYAPVVEIRNPSASTSAINIFANGGPAIRVYDGSGYQRGAWNQDGSIVVGQSNTKLATLSVYADSATSVGTIIRGAASQTANLQEWQDNAGNIKALVGSGGNAVFNGIRSGSGSTTGAINAYTTAAQIGILVRGASSQTANLQEWQNSAGTVLASIDANGQASFKSTTLTASSSEGSSLTLVAASGQTAPLLTTSGGAQISAGGNYFRAPGIEATYVMNVTSGNLGTIPFIVKGAASQTADLQQWQDSAGTVLAYVAANGHLLTPRLNITNGGNIVDSAGTTPYFAFGSNQIAIYARNAAYKPLVIQGAASQSANLQEWQRSDGFVLLNVSKHGDVTAGPGSSTAIRFRYFDGINITGTYWDTVETNSATFIGRSTTAATMVVRGAASQTANLQEWQDSSGTILARVNSAGNIYTSGYLTAGVQSPTGTLTVVSKGVSVPVAVIKGAASQTADLQQWQNSSGTVLASVDSYGNMVSQALSTGITRVSFAGLYGASLNVIPYGTAQQGIIVRAVASQTADLQQWQDSSGTVISKISKDGQFYGYGSQYGGSQYGSIGALGLAVGGQSGETSIHYAGGNLTVRSSTTGDSSSGSAWTNNTSALIGTGYAGGIGLIIKSVASQTADLQQWQDSSGNIKSKIISDGSIIVGGGSWTKIDSTYGQVAVRTDGVLLGSLTVGTGVGSVIGLVVKGATSQTANLQEWQDVNGTVLSKIKSTGALEISASDSTRALYVNNSNASGYGMIVNASGGRVFQAQVNGTTKFFVDGTGLFRIGLGASAPSGVFHIDMASAGNGSASNLGLTIRSNTSQTQTGDLFQIQDASSNAIFAITPGGAIKGGNSNTISVNTASTVDTVALSSFTSIEYTLSIKQGSKIRSSKVLVHTDGTSVDSTEYGIMEMGGGITGILVTASVSGTDAILQVTITDAATTNATVKLIKTML